MSLFAEGSPKRWALCFDELELAPAWLQKRLLGELRSTNQRFLFKLGTSPFPDVEGSLAAKPKADCSLIALWRHAGKDIRAFSARLSISVLRQRGLHNTTVRKLLGNSPSVHAREWRGTRVGRLTKERSLKVVKTAALHDAALRDLLCEYDIDPEKPWMAASDRRKIDVLAQVVPLAAHRSAFKAKHIERLQPPVNSRVLPYYGEDVLYDISDGNPRWLIGMLNDLIRAGVSEGKTQRVPRKVQAQVYRTASLGYHTMLETMPAEPPAAAPEDSVHVVEVVDEFGCYFFRSVVQSEFNLHPFESFTVDAKTPERVLRVLPSGTYEGAFICMDPGLHQFAPKPDGRLFRLSYMLAPYFGLPLALHNKVNASAVSSEARRRMSVEEPRKRKK